MKLRNTIRPPKRFDSEFFYTPGSHRSLRRPESVDRPAYIDFNPNLPPAAFPTRDRPRPGEVKVNGTHTQANDIRVDGAEQAGQSHQNGQTGTSEAETIEFAHIPMDEFENYVASNNELNPVYTSNMAIMRTVEENPYKDMEDSDSDEVIEDMPETEEARPIDNLQWYDLTPRMQLEMFNNLLERYSFLAVCKMLGLTVEEREKMLVHSRQRNKQMEQENSNLEEMHAKQIRALKRIDHTTMEHRKIPHQLVLRKITRQCDRTLSRRPEADYLFCQSGELLNARQFLHRRGIERRYAGDWGNSFVTMRSSEPDSEPDMFEWKESVEGRTHPLEEETPKPLSPTPCRDPGIDAYVKLMISRQSYINDAGGASFTVNPKELAKSKGYMFMPPRWLEDHQRELNKRKFDQHQQGHEEDDGSKKRAGVVCLKIGTRQATQIRNSERSYLDQDNVFYPSIASCYQSVSPEQLNPYEVPGMVNHSTFPNFPPVFPNTKCRAVNPLIPIPGPFVLPLPKQPVQRTMGGTWSYNSIRFFSEPPVTPAFIVRQRLENAKLEALREKSGQVNDGNATINDRKTRKTTSPPASLQRPVRTAERASSATAVNRDQPILERPTLLEREEISLCSRELEAFTNQPLDLDTSTGQGTSPSALLGQDNIKIAEQDSTTAVSTQDPESEHGGKDTEGKSSNGTDPTDEGDEMARLPNEEAKRDAANTE